MNPFQDKVDRLNREIERLTGGSARDREMAIAFPLGTGRPGNASSRRTRRSAMKSIERAQANAAKARKLIERRGPLEVKARAFDRDEIDRFGQLTELGREQQRIAEDREQRKRDVASEFHENFARFIHATRKPGDVVYVSGNPVTLAKVNRKSVVTVGGAKWKMDEIVPARDDGTEMSPREAVAAVREFVESLENFRAKFSKEEATKPAKGLTPWD